MKTIKRNKPLAIAARPKCPQCLKPLRPYWVMVKEQRRGPVSEWRVELEWQGEYHRYGHFCTLRCTERYANAVVNKLQGFQR